MVGLFGGILNRMSWSGTQGFNTAAATPHEQKMGNVLSSWRAGFSVLMFVLLAIAAYTFLNNRDFAASADQVRSELAAKTLQDVAPGDRFASVRKEVKEFLETRRISPTLQARMDRVEREEKKDEVQQPQIGVDESGEIQQAAAGTEIKPITSEAIPNTVQTALKSEDRGKAGTFRTIFSQMRVPIALRTLLPIGITGIFCALMIFLMVSTDTAYMHSWGSIIVQDVILPFRKTPFTPRQHLFLLRLIIFLVALFAFLFSFFFSQIDYILMFFAITGAIWLGGAGPCIVLGLYWKRGTTLGAFAALISGGMLSVSGILLQKYWMSHIYPFLMDRGWTDSIRWFLETVSSPFHPYVVWTVTPDKFPINSQEIYFITMIVSLGLYIGLSLLSSKEAFNMDRMLHRGQYRREGEEVKHEKFTFKRLLGIDSQYTKGDRILAWSVFLWSFGWGFGSFLVLVIWNTISPWPNAWWANWFFATSIILPAVIGVVTTIWFSIGGTWDLIRLFRRLEEKQVDTLDDGRVIGHVSADDLALLEKVEAKDPSGL